MRLKELVSGAARRFVPAQSLSAVNSLALSDILAGVKKDAAEAQDLLRDVARKIAGKTKLTVDESNRLAALIKSGTFTEGDITSAVERILHFEEALRIAVEVTALAVGAKEKKRAADERFLELEKEKVKLNEISVNAHYSLMAADQALTELCAFARDYSELFGDLHTMDNMRELIQRHLPGAKV